jgi:hypothetical protein
MGPTMLPRLDLPVEWRVYKVTMTTETTPFQEAGDILAKCDVSMDELEAKCCAPRRSPQMEELRRTLAQIRVQLARAHESWLASEATVEVLAEAGEQIGRLQVTCCAPSRMPLYEGLLNHLMQVQRIVKRHAKLAH